MLLAMKRDGGRNAISNQSIRLSGSGVKAILTRPIFTAKPNRRPVELLADIVTFCGCCDRQAKIAVPRISAAESD